MTIPERLYGLPGAEFCHSDIQGVIDSDIDPFFDDDSTATWVVEEWTVKAPIDMVPSADRIIEDIVETMYDDGTWPNDNYVTPPDVRKDSVLIAAAENLRDLFATRLNWHSCDEKVGKYTVTLAKDGGYLVDAESDSNNTKGAHSEPTA